MNLCIIFTTYAYLYGRSVCFLQISLASEGITCSSHCNNQSTYLFFKNFKNIFLDLVTRPNFISTWSLLRKNLPNLLNPKMMLHNHSHVHFKASVAQILFLSKLRYFLFWFVLKVPQFWKKRDSCNWLLKMNGL